MYLGEPIWPFNEHEIIHILFLVFIKKHYVAD